MFKSLDENLYEKVGHNPVLLLERLSYERKEEIVKDRTIMKKVKEDFYERGITADSYRPVLSSGIDGLINQISSEVNTDETTEHDGTDNILLSPNGDQSGNSSTDQGSES